MKRSAVANHSDTVAKALSTNVSIVLMKVSVPAKEGSIIPIMDISHHPHIMGFSNHPHIMGFSLTSSYT
jgi:hypothetical protein